MDQVKLSFLSTTTFDAASKQLQQVLLASILETKNWGPEQFINGPKLGMETTALHQHARLHP